MESGDGIEIGSVTDGGHEDTVTVAEVGQSGSPRIERAKRAAHTAKDAVLVPRMTSESWPAVAKAVERAVASSTTTPGRTVRFALGVITGFVASMALVGVLALVYPMSAPFALLYLVLPVTIATGLVFTRIIPLKDGFTTAAHLKLERAQYLLKAKNEALDIREAQMRQNDVPGPEIEALLRPDRQRAQEEYFKVLDEVSGEAPAKTSPDDDGTPKLPP